MNETEFEIKARAALDRLEDKARQMGLYVDSAHVLLMPVPQASEPEMVFAVNFTLGDIAFSDRVQNPDKHATDSMIRTLEMQMRSDDFLEQRTKIQENIAAGRDPFDDGADSDLGN